MVIEDPDSEEMAEITTIEIMVPGTHLEREIRGDEMFGILLGAAGGFGLMILSTLGLIILLLATGHIYFIGTNVVFRPWALIITSLSELALIVPPLGYVIRKRLSYRSVGLKSISLTGDLSWGVAAGLIMMGCNIVITWMMSILMPEFNTGTQPLVVSDISELVGWIVIMFVVVGFSEELLFRGLIQRRMEFYFRTQHNMHYRSLALFITSVIFAAIHLDLIGMPTRLVLGLFLGYTAQKRRYGILAPTVAHGLNNSFAVIFSALGW